MLFLKLQITPALKGILCVTAIATMLSACGGGLFFTGKANTNSRSDKKNTDQGSGDNEKASEPEVVTGSYLTCEMSTSDKKTNPSDEVVGCSVLYKDHPVVAANGSTIELSETSTKTSGNNSTLAMRGSQSNAPEENVAPAGDNSNSNQVTTGPTSLVTTGPTGQDPTRLPDVFTPNKNPQGVFIINSKETARSKTYTGRILDKNNKIIKAFTCDGNKLPCTDQGVLIGDGSPITVSLAGIWAPEALLKDTSTKIMLRPGCPVDPNLLCYAAGNLSKPGNMQPAQQKACLTLLERGAQTLNVFHFGHNAPDAFSRATIDPKTECVVKRISLDSSVPQLINRGSNGCALAMVKTKDNRSAKHLIFKISDMPTDLEAKLASIQCAD